MGTPHELQSTTSIVSSNSRVGYANHPRFLWTTSSTSEDRFLSKSLMETTVRLTNLRAHCVGISQIHNVYMPIWKASEDEQLWVDLGDMTFGDVWKRDRVSRFHLVVVDEE